MQLTSSCIHAIIFCLAQRHRLLHCMSAAALTMAAPYATAAVLALRTNMQNHLSPCEQTMHLC